MGSRTGRGNRVVWDTQKMLDELSRSLTKKEMLAAFRKLPTEEQLSLLVRLSDSAALERAGGGSDGSK